MMKTLQLGMEWFPDRPGGLDRYYYDCCKYLPQANINITCLLAGSDKVVQDSNLIGIKIDQLFFVSIEA